MSYIKVNTSTLSDYRSGMASTACSIDSVANRLDTISNSLDWQVKAKENVSQSLNEIKKSVRKGQELIEQYNSAVSAVMERFNEADSTAAANINGVNNMFDSLAELAAIIPNISDGLSIAKSSSIFDKIKDIFDLQTVLGLAGTTGGFAAVLSALANIATGQTSTANTAEATSLNPWTWLKDALTAASGASGVANILEYLYGENSMSDALSAFKDSTLMKSVGIVKDVETAVTALKNGDMDSLRKVAEKYAGKGVKTVLEMTYGVGSSTAGILVNLGAELYENILDIDEYAGINSSYSTIGGLAAYTWHVTGGTVTDYVIDTSLDIVKAIDVFSPTKYLTSIYETVDADSVYDVWGEIFDAGKDIFSNNSFGEGVNLIVDSTKDYVADVVADKVMDFVVGLFK